MIVQQEQNDILICEWGLNGVMKRSSLSLSGLLLLLAFVMISLTQQNKRGVRVRWSICSEMSFAFYTQ